MNISSKIALAMSANGASFEEVHTSLEKIADDYAIKFSEWCVNYRDKNKNINREMLHSISKYDDTYLTKELLEIFKKEKNL